MTRALKAEVDAAKTQVEELGAAQQEEANSFRADLNAAEARVRELTEQTAAQVDKAVSTFEQRMSALESSIETQKGRLDSAIAQFQQQFSAAESSRADLSTRTVADQATKYAQAATELREEFDRARADLQAAVAETNKFLEAEKDRAERLLGTLSSTVYSGNYGRYADAQRREADTWRRIASWTIVALIVFGVYLATGLAGQQFDWGKVVERALFTVPFFVLAGFAVSQSNHHRDREGQARRVELEIAAIDPFIALLPEAEGSKLKVDVGTRLFSPATEVREIGPQALGVGQLLDLLGKALDKLR